MSPKDHPAHLTIRLICRDLPPTVYAGAPTEFGLQDKRQQLDAGQLDSEGVQRFIIALTAPQQAAPLGIVHTLTQTALSSSDGFSFGME